MGAKHWHEYAELAGGPPGRKRAPARSDAATPAATPTRVRHTHELASIAGGLPRSKRPGAVPLPPAVDANGQRRARHAHEYAELAGGPPAWAKDKPKKVPCPCTPVHSVAERRTRIGRHAHDFAELAGGPVARKPKKVPCPCDVGPVVAPRPPAKFERQSPTGALGARRGADAWFKLPPGTYTLGLAKGEVESGMRLDVFSADNLSQPLRPLPRRQRVLTVEPARCSAGTVRNRVPCTYETERFFGGDGELYLRVYSPDGLTYGEASLLVLKHDCASEDTACELLPAKPLTPAVPLNKPYTGYFTFSSIATANPRVPQTLVFQGTTLDGTDPRSPDLSLERDGLPVRSLLPSDGSVVVMTEEAHEANYLLKVSRPSDTTRYSVGVVTDLTYVSGAKDDLPPWMTAGISPPPSPIAFKLVCLEEGGLGIGDEELSVKVVADGVQVAGPIFRGDLDADEAMDLSSIPNFGFVERAYLLIEEHDGDLVTDPVQDTATLELYKLDPMRPEGASHQQVVTLHPVGDPRTLNGPTVQFQYHTSHSKVP